MRPAPIDPPQIHDRLWAGVGGTTGWDVGANCGQSLGEMTTRFTQVLAFEPATECLPLLHEWATQSGISLTGGGTLRVLDVAVSDTDGTIELTDIPDKISTGQLVTAGTHGMEWDADTSEARPRLVPARTLDSLAAQFGAPDFCKVDVEGHEGHVLAGAATLLRDTRPQWLIEFHSRTLYDLCTQTLHDAGYQITTIRHPHYQPGSALWQTHGWIRAQQ